VTRNVQLSDVEPPPFELGDELPSISASEFEARLAALRAAVAADWIVVYGDR
jgi:hypothetical protein